MPQMSPLWWLTLMLMFNSMIMLSISMLYFNYNNSFKVSTTSQKINLNWMW
uniref:ATP synthase F0 subunit 8 n=1 Tax=Gargara genistae TaxID=1464907 RepID=UPI001EDFA65F|nr:ATP synthase F0 subunit 8 [Gargara genistae]UKB86912.1 ATP synthase F0 subunit 8 [Gargara genistae]